MRASFVFLTLLGAAPLALAIACSNHDDCASRATCEAPTTGTTQPEAGAEASGPKVYPAVPPPNGCVVSADPSSSSSCLSEAYALFVDAANGRDENPGTKAAPLKTLAAAVDLDRLAGRRRIYVTSAAQSGNFVLPIGVSLAGGFTAAWERPAGQTTAIDGVAGKGPTVSVVESPEDVVLSDLVITSPTTTFGESSIGVFVAAKTVTVYRLNVHSGLAGDGVRKAVQSNRRKENGGGVTADTSANICTCSLYGTTTGGGAGASGQPGNAGTSNPAASGGGRNGEGGGASCTDGHPGGDGAGGAGGTSSPFVATIDSSGWHASDGLDGKPGEPGGGGGGAGNGGGSGACGGCGGAGGRGGGAGGSSIGVVAYQCMLTLVATTIASEGAGRGADGGKGEIGELGAAGGPGACKGGQGGTGGGGGGGSGGAAGISAAVARTGGELKYGADTTLTQKGGGQQGGKGDPGEAASATTLGLGQAGHAGAPGAAAPASYPVIVLQ